MNKLVLLGELDSEIQLTTERLGIMDKIAEDLEGKRLRADANRALIRNRLDNLVKGREVLETLCQTEIDSIEVF